MIRTLILAFCLLVPQQRAIDRQFLEAVQQRDVEKITSLLSRGANVNARYGDNRNNTVLMEAANGTSLEIIAVLLNAGADVKASNVDGKTALMIAAGLDHRVTPKDRLPMIELLIKKGSDINATDKNGKTPLLHSVVQYMSEAGGLISHVEVVKLLLDRGADVQASDERGDNALMIALDVWRGAPEIPRVLIEKGINLNAQNKKGTTALMIAAVEGKIEAVRLLLERGADPNLKDADGRTALDFAAESGRDEVAKFLFAKGVTAKATYKSEAELQKTVINSALLRAASLSELEEIKKQLALGADINTRSSNGQTPLMMAIDYSYGRIDAPRFLIDQGADVNAADTEGNTPLMFAIRRNNYELFQELLARKARAYVRNKEGRTPLHLASAGLQDRFIEALLATKPEVGASSAGVDIWKVDVNGRDAAGKTPLMLAANNGSFVPTDAMQALLNGGAEIDAQDPEGNTALMISAASGSMSGVEFLLKKHAAVNLKNAKGESALSQARKIHTIKKYSDAAELERRIVRMLVDAGAK